MVAYHPDFNEAINFTLSFSSSWATMFLQVMWDMISGESFRCFRSNFGFFWRFDCLFLRGLWIIWKRRTLVMSRLRNESKLVHRECSTAQRGRPHSLSSVGTAIFIEEGIRENCLLERNVSYQWINMLLIWLHVCSIERKATALISYENAFA